MNKEQLIYALIITLASFLLFFISLFIYSNMKNEQKEKFAKYRYCYIIIAYLTGYLLYFYGTFLQNDSLSGFNRVIYSSATSIGYTAKMILGGIDTGAVKTALTQNWYLISFSIIHIICFTIAELVVVNVFGKSIINYIRLKGFHSDEGIILMGNYEKIDYFLRHSRQRKRKILLIIDNEWTEKEKKEIYNYHRPILYMNKLTQDNFHKIPLRQKSDQSESILICLYENDRKTINTAAIVRNYLNLHPDFNLSCYFNLSEYETTRIVDENSALSKKDGKIRFFNKADLVARDFVERNTVFDLAPSCIIHPKSATVSDYDLFYCFIGFGELGQQLLKKTLINHCLLNCRYSASVFDKEGKELESLFYRRNPGMSGELANRYATITFHENMQVSSREFKEKFMSSLKKDNAIFVCLKDDLLAVQMALDMKRMIQNIIMDHKEVIHANIFIHVRSRGEYLKLITEQANDDCKTIQLHLIGANNEIYTYEKIVDETGDLLAKRIDRAYNVLKERKNDFSDEEDNLCWNRKSSQFNKNSSLMAAMNIKTKLQLIGLDLIRETDYQKHPERYVKIDHSQLFVLKDGTYHLNIVPSENESNGTYFDLSGNNKDYQALQQIYFQYDHPATNLARQEHQRWNLFHLVNGWDSMPYVLKDGEDYEYDANNPYEIITKNKNLFRHMDLVSWEELKKLQDYQVAHLIRKYGKKAEKDFVYQCDVLKFDYFTIFGLSAILKNSGFLIVQRKKPS